jgi:hypothetical protein
MVAEACGATVSSGPPFSATARISAAYFIRPTALVLPSFSVLRGAEPQAHPGRLR